MSKPLAIGADDMGLLLLIGFVASLFAGMFTERAIGRGVGTLLAIGMALFAQRSGEAFGQMGTISLVCWQLAIVLCMTLQPERVGEIGRAFGGMLLSRFGGKIGGNGGG